MALPTCREIVNGAFQDAFLTEANETPTDSDADVGLELLKSLYRHLVIGGTLGRMTSRLVTGDYTAGENERIVNGTDDAVTITLPTEVEAEEDPGIEGVDTAYRQPAHLALAEVVGDTPAVSIYDASVGSWVSIEDLTLNSTAPLGQVHRFGLQAMLAVRLCPRFRVPVPDVILAEAVSGRRAMTMNWHAPQLPVQATYF